MTISALAAANRLAPDVPGPSATDEMLRLYGRGRDLIRTLLTICRAHLGLNPTDGASVAARSRLLARREELDRAAVRALAAVRAMPEPGSDAEADRHYDTYPEIRRWKLYVSTLPTSSWKEFSGASLMREAMTPLEVVDMGMRGFTRKIGILKDYNANFQCGQCHNAANRYLTYNWTKDGKPVTKEDLKKAGISPYSTEFFRNPIESWEFFKKLGWNQGTNGPTGVKMVNGSDHPHVEILLGSKNGQAGVTCTDCHFAKKADGTMEHQPSLTKMKVQNTCLRSDCHGKGTKDNWSEGQALYTIEAIQQEYRIRTQKMEMDAYISRGLLADVKAGKIVIPEKEMQQLNDAYERYLATRDWYFTDLSTGFHDPDGFNASATKVIWDLRTANAAAKKVMKPAAQKTASTK